MHLVGVNEDALQRARYIYTTYTTAAIAARTHSVSCAASVSAECQVNPTDRPLQCNGSWAYPRLAVNVHTVALQQVVPVPVHPDFWMPRMLLPHLQLARSLGIGAALGFDSTQQPRPSWVPVPRGSGVYLPAPRYLIPDQCYGRLRTVCFRQVLNCGELYFEPRHVLEYVDDRSASSASLCTNGIIWHRYVLLSTDTAAGGASIWMCSSMNRCIRIHSGPWVSGDNSPQVLGCTSKGHQPSIHPLSRVVGGNLWNLQTKANELVEHTCPDNSIALSSLPWFPELCMQAHYEYRPRVLHPG